MTDADIGALLTQREYALHRRCSTRTVERERAEGTGCPYIRIGSRILYKRSDIDRFIDAHRIGPSGFPKGSCSPPAAPASISRDPHAYAPARASAAFSAPRP